MNVCVVGLGKIGLPLAVQFARKGQMVIGVDIDPRVVDAVNEGRAPFPGEAHLSERLLDVVGNGSLCATIETTQAAASSEVVIVIVPLVIDDRGHPDFSGIDRATEAIGRGLRKGTLVSYETTLPLHGTRRLGELLEKTSGLKAGDDFFLCHSPERIFSGRIFADLSRYPKLVGATDPEGAAKAVSFYEAVLDFDERTDLRRANGVWDLGSPESAELAKLAETSYRNLNIAFANELAMAADRAGVDVARVIEASNSQPYSHIHQPGIAVGGHCIPVYPHFLVDADKEMRLVDLGLSINDGMPSYGIALLTELLGGLEGARVAILGASYRPGVKELSFSGVFALQSSLEALGAIPMVHDPLFSPEELEHEGLRAYSFGEPSDGLVLHTAHEQYAALNSGDVPGVKGVVDGRGILDPSRWPGVRFRRIGDGGPQE